MLGIWPDGAEHGIQGEAHEQRQRHGEGHRDAEGEEKAPHDAAHEGHGYEHGQEREGGGDDRLPAGLDRFYFESTNRRKLSWRLCLLN